MNDELKKLQEENRKLKDELRHLKKTKKFGLVWEEREREKNIDDGEYYPYLTPKGEGFGFENGDGRKNILIEGDNYHALEILQYTHKGKVDVIYIDPPYNTGKKNEFRYGDRWVDVNDGYRHSYWLSFMNKRLRLAKDLLAKDGVIFISIDDNEQARLKLLCDEIFGEGNFVEQLIWKRRSTPPNDRIIGKNHEYIFLYSKNIERMKLYLQPRSNELNSRFSNPDNDPRGEWVASDLSANGKGGRLTKSCIFEIVNPVNKKSYYPPQNKCWLFNEEKVNQLILEGKIGFRKTTGTPFLKRYLSEVRQGETLATILNNHGFSQDSAKEMRDLFGNDIFDFPKPIKLLKTLLLSSCKKNSIILDFFAGSGTTGHALMQLVKEKQEAQEPFNPHYILVTNNENNICEEVCYERLKRANQKYNYNSNLEYLKTELLKYDESKHCDLDIRAFMVDKLLEIIKVRESCFITVDMTPFLKRFDKLDKSVYILHNIYDMKSTDYKEVTEKLNQDTNQTINIYLLAIANHAHYAQKLSGKCDKELIFEPLPETFLKLLRKIERKQRK